MSHGLPDWYRGVDIAYQALAEMIIRPKYGAAQAVLDSVSALANVETPIVTVSGKGMIYGGYLFCNPAAVQTNSKPMIYIDDQLMMDLTWSQLNAYIKDVTGIAPFVLVEYSDANSVYGVGINYGFTFEQSVKLAYDEKHGNATDIYYGLHYAVI